ncbi:hypothetical protein EVG20_g4474 [Dentipellis fragilis]|uniref:Uncharacterized protein n=1 Tax=Dentipellis fragilis TaxID=205917 RepID=A0A4Y9YZS2_9AGAM|nr:hypothetical protein EVG20_g4474 [Dentipellis fragilis]
MHLHNHHEPSRPSSLAQSNLHLADPRPDLSIRSLESATRQGVRTTTHRPLSEQRWHSGLQRHTSRCLAIFVARAKPELGQDAEAARRDATISNETLDAHCAAHNEAGQIPLHPTRIASEAPATPRAAYCEVFVKLVPMQPSDPELGALTLSATTLSEPGIYACVTRSAHARDTIGRQALSCAACGTTHGAAESSRRAAVEIHARRPSLYAMHGCRLTADIVSAVGRGSMVISLFLVDAGDRELAGAFIVTRVGLESRVWIYGIRWHPDSVTMSGRLTLASFGASFAFISFDPMWCSRSTRAVISRTSSMV